MFQDSEVIAFARAVSRLLGWIYVFSWSLSFYPQIILNWNRRSTHGLAIDFPTVNSLGFCSYTLSTAFFLYSPTIRSQYAFRHPAAPEPTVRFNDFAFALHGATLCIITYSQFYSWIWGFKVGVRQRASKFVLTIFWGSIASVIAVAIFVRVEGKDGGYDPSGWAWIEVIYALSYVKLVCTLIKYCPQVWVNYKRQSTVGWSIDQILLDVVGGVLSVLQLIIDSSLQADWSGLTGNPAKFALGNISIVFDIIFITQHYVLYRKNNNRKTSQDGEDWDGERRPLVNSEH